MQANYRACSSPKAVLRGYTEGHRRGSDPGTEGKPEAAAGVEEREAEAAGRKAVARRGGGGATALPAEGEIPQVFFLPGQGCGEGGTLFFCADLSGMPTISPK